MNILLNIHIITFIIQSFIPDRFPSSYKESNASLRQMFFRRVCDAHLICKSENHIHSPAPLKCRRICSTKPTNQNPWRKMHTHMHTQRKSTSSVHTALARGRIFIPAPSWHKYTLHTNAPKHHRRVLFGIVRGMRHKRSFSLINSNRAPLTGSISGQNPRDWHKEPMHMHLFKTFPRNQLYHSMGCDGSG